MRRVVHRILTGFPAFALAILALLTAADPAGARVRLAGFVELMGDERFFWLCVAFVTGYFVIWWLTSIEPKSRRRRILAGLRPHYEALSQIQAIILNAQTEGEYLAAVPNLEARLQQTVDWLSANMSAAAVEKFKYPPTATMATHWTFSNHTGASAAKRGNMVTLNKARVEALDSFLRYDGWDGEDPSLWQRAVAQLKKMKLPV